jgi:hypothetical protein
VIEKRVAIFGRTISSTFRHVQALCLHSLLQHFSRHKNRPALVQLLLLSLIVIVLALLRFRRRVP